MVTVNDPAVFLRAFFPPLPQSAAMLEMCEHINVVEELPAWKKRRKFLANIRYPAMIVPISGTGARIGMRDVMSEFERGLDMYSDRLRLRR